MAKFLALLLHVALVLALVASSNADTLHPHRRDHLDLGRVIKKRTPQPGLGVLGPAAQAQSPSTQPTVVQPTPSTVSAAETTPVNSTPVKSEPSASSDTPSAAVTSTTSGGGGLLGNLVSNLLPTTTTSSTSSTSSPVHTSSPPAPQTTAQLSSPTSQSPSILYVTSTSAPTPTQTSTTSGSTGMSSAAMTVLIVIAASVGAVIIVWTIIRKWKFRPSSDFEGRMQPIDWQPGGNDPSGLPGEGRPLSRASSFHSGSSHPDDQMRGKMAGYGNTPLNPIPDHDFTAGPAHLAPVGGYADLSRSLSPQPTMQEPFGRAPSVNPSGQYDHYGVPLHHGYGGY